MSETTSIAAVGPSYWIFMATVMAARLESFIERQQVISEEIPEGVYKGVTYFFELVMGAAGEKRPKSPPPSINAYLVATDALRGSLRPFPETNRDLLARLDRYSTFIKGLGHSHPITDADELETAASLRDFFVV